MRENRCHGIHVASTDIHPTTAGHTVTSTGDARSADRSAPGDRTPRVAVITGASRGLGAGIASRLATRQVRLGLCARNRPGVPAPSSPAITAAVDVTDPEAVDAFAARVTEELGPIDLWINNAGVLDPIGPLRDAPTDQLATHVDVNLNGVIWGSRAFARIVHDRDEPGVLVNISSGAAGSAYHGWAAYCATKAAVDQLSRVLAVEEAAHGLSVFAVAPGVVDTDMQASIRATPPEVFPHVERFLDLARTDSFNTPEWVADHLIELYGATTGGPAPEWFDATADPVVVRIPTEG